MDSEVDLDTLPIEDLAQHVWDHWQKTKEVLETAQRELRQIGEKAKDRNAAAIVLLNVPLHGYLDVSVPQVYKILSLQVGLWKQYSRRQKKRREAEVRRKILGHLAHSNMIREDVKKVLATARELR